MAGQKKGKFISGRIFLAGRSLTYPVIAGSLLLTNLSTEQMVGLNGSAFKEGMSVMAWEVMAVVALILIWGRIAPMSVPYEERNAGVTDLTPWKFAFPVAIGLIVLIVIIYASFADFSALSKGKPAYPTVQQQLSVETPTQQ